MSLPKRLFVTGTDTDVGKTFISAILTLGLRAKYWKPIQSGTIEGTDSKLIEQITGLSADHFYPEGYLLTQPLSPHAAAAIDGIEIDITKLNLPGHPDEALIVEGAGGVMVPIDDQHFILDVIQRFALPALVVSRSALGTINHTVLTLDRLRLAGVPIAGVVMNGKLNPGNKQAIEHYGQTKVIAEIEPLEIVSPGKLLDIFEEQFEKHFALQSVRV